MISRNDNENHTEDGNIEGNENVMNLVFDFGSVPKIHSRELFWFTFHLTFVQRKNFAGAFGIAWRLILRQPELENTCSANKLKLRPIAGTGGTHNEGK